MIETNKIYTGDCRKETTMYGNKIMAALSSSLVAETFMHIYRVAEVTQMCSKGARVYKLLIRESDHDDPLRPWGWWSFGDDGFVLVHYTLGLLDICFPHGTGGEETKGEGIKLPVDIEAIDTVYDGREYLHGA